MAYWLGNMKRSHSDFSRKLRKVIQQDDVCIVLGMDNQTGLSIAHCLGVYGVKVIGMDQRQLPIGRFSKYCSYFFRFVNYQHLLSMLSDLGEYRDKKIPIIASSDIAVLFMDENKNTLNRNYLFNWQSQLKQRNIIDKKKMIRLAQDAGLDTPLTFCNDEMSVSQIQKQMIYPAIVKPPYTMGKKKGILVRSGYELEKVLTHELFEQGFIIQEYIVGPEDNIHIVGSYSGRDAKVVVASCGVKIRQLPKDMGVATHIHAQENEEILFHAARLLEHINYFGISGIEFKRSLTDGRYKFIEINPRVSGYNEFCLAQGMNLPHLCYLDLLGRLNRDTLPQYLRKNVSWVSILDDLHTFFRFYFLRSPQTISGFVKDLISADTYAVDPREDLLPFIFSTIDNFKKGFILFRDQGEKAVKTFAQPSVD